MKVEPELPLCRLEKIFTFLPVLKRIKQPVEEGGFQEVVIYQFTEEPLFKHKKARGDQSRSSFAKNSHGQIIWLCDLFLHLYLNAYNMFFKHNLLL